MAGSGNLYIRAYSICNGAPPPNDVCTNAWTLLDSMVYTGPQTRLRDRRYESAVYRAEYDLPWRLVQLQGDCPGTAIVDACGSDFDTKIVVFTNAAVRWHRLGATMMRAPWVRRQLPLHRGDRLPDLRGRYGGHAAT